MKEERFLKSIVKKHENKKHQIQKELENVQTEIDNLKQKN